MISIGLDNTEEKAPESYARSSASVFAEVCSSSSDIQDEFYSWLHCNLFATYPLFMFYSDFLFLTYVGRTLYMVYVKPGPV